MSKTFLAKKSVYDITKFTTLDFKDHLACIIWFAKCNMRCSYCYNSKIVDGEGTLSNEEVLEFLKSRIGKLDGVVLSGGECTLNPDIVDLCDEIKDLGYEIKIDTNGLKPNVLKELINLSLVDFIALDYKAPSSKFEQITKNNQIENFYQTLDMLIDKKFPFEVRTTVHHELLNEENINEIIFDLNKRKYTGTYYLQNYLHVDDTIEKLSQNSPSINKSLLSDTLPIEFRN
ncbi:anaerobic ribonucleoside-triphosphate reductase activating protein [Sulfurospirillum arcachonense]|uniref:anaerobic ribonucleoside-triphosphate reductase activating protein n=1 Tax=Sulfurospirillum arcachonense TaxID=57666 RepID=UPI0004696858|nr:anaerobic ribonucleoside-triphosphate reductase activating protein [Sulfurospirillum arcachonense]